jgi:hypothetical protein
MKSHGNKKDFYQRNKFRIIAYVLLLTLTSLMAYMAIDHNRDAAYCAYVEEGEFYHVHIHGQPCVLTSVVFEKLFLYMIPCVILLEICLFIGKVMTTWRN